MDEADFSRFKVGIIGGKGRMGRWLQQRLQETGHQVLIADALDGPTPPELVRACRVLILAVPIAAMEEVVTEIAPYLRNDGVILDIASLKEEPLKIMLAHAPGEVIGLHPFFGPSVESMEGHIVFLCPAQAQRWLGWVKNFWEAGGATVVEIEPQRHDRLMAQVQTLRHLMLACMGRVLMQTGFAQADDLDLAGPWFKTLVSMLAHQCDQPAELYAGLALNNPNSQPVIQAFEQSVQEVSHLMNNKEPAALVSWMEEVGSFIKSEKHAPLLTKYGICGIES